MFKNKRKHKFDTTEPTQENQHIDTEIKDEYTLGKKSDESKGNIYDAEVIQGHHHRD